VTATTDRCAVTVLHKTTRPGRRWRPGDELREVFTFTIEAAHPHRAAHVARALALHLEPGCCEEHHDQASAYQATGLRPLQVGDVLLVSRRNGDGRAGQTPLEIVGIGVHPFAAGHIPDFTSAASTTGEATAAPGPARRPAPPASGLKRRGVR